MRLVAKGFRSFDTKESSVPEDLEMMRIRLVAGVGTRPGMVRVAVALHRVVQEVVVLLPASGENPTIRSGSSMADPPKSSARTQIAERADQAWIEPRPLQVVQLLRVAVAESSTPRSASHENRGVEDSATATLASHDDATSLQTAREPQRPATLDIRLAKYPRNREHGGVSASFFVHRPI